MIGELNKRATLQNPTVTKTGSGGTEVTYVDFATVWCSHKDYSSARPRATFDTISEGGQNNQQASIVMVFRWSKDIRTNLTKDTRVVMNGFTYSIAGMESMDKKYVKLLLTGIKNTITGIY